MNNSKRSIVDFLGVFTTRWLGTCSSVGLSQAVFALQSVDAAKVWEGDHHHFLF